MPFFVESIHVYPLKSARAVAVRDARVSRRGLVHDRRFMVVDDAGTFVTQRTMPRLALVAATIDGDALVLDAPAMATLRVPLEPDGARRDVVVWKSTCAAVSAGDAARRWLSDFLGTPADLVFMPDSTERSVSLEYGRAGDVTSFADAFPVLIASMSSLDDLNRRMSAPLPMSRFRPNVVVRGAPPWDEDDWKTVTIGEVTMRVVKACDRCVVTTIDQATAEKGVEPLKTLATFRARAGKVYFAVNAIPDDEAIVRVGDEVTVTR